MQTRRLHGGQGWGTGRGPWRSLRGDGWPSRARSMLRTGPQGLECGRTELAAGGRGGRGKSGSRWEAGSQIEPEPGPPASSAPPYSPAQAHVLRLAQDGGSGRAEPLLQPRGHAAGGQARVQLYERHVQREGCERSPGRNEARGPGLCS